MGKHTPPMTDAELADYLDKHLGNELKWLLRAATEWHVQDILKLEIDGYNVQVYAMDSTFLRVRTLFEFLTQKTTANYYGVDVFGLAPLASLYQQEWKGPLHSAVMHAQDRSCPGPVRSFDAADPPKHLKDMPVDLGREMVRLWREFAVALGAHTNPAIARLGKRADSIVSEAISDATRVVKNPMVSDHGVGPVSW